MLLRGCGEVTTVSLQTRSVPGWTPFEGNEPSPGQGKRGVDPL